MKRYMSPVRSAGGSEASVSGDSLHQSMVPRGAVGFQVRVEWALRKRTHTETHHNTNKMCTSSFTRTNNESLCILMPFCWVDCQNWSLYPRKLEQQLVLLGYSSSAFKHSVLRCLTFRIFKVWLFTGFKKKKKKGKMPFSHI